MEQRPQTDVASQWSAPSAAWGPPPDPWAPPPDPWTPPPGSQQPTQPPGWQPEPSQEQAPLDYGQVGPQPHGVVPGRAQAGRRRRGALIAAVVAALVVLVAALAGIGIVLARHQAGRAKDQRPAAQAPATAPGATTEASPSTQGSTTTGDTIVTSAFSFERPAGWRDASGAARTPGAVDLDRGERVDCALIGLVTRVDGAGILVSSIDTPKASEATRADAEALGAAAVLTLKANPEVVEAGNPSVTDLGGVPAAEVTFHRVLGGDKVAGSDLAAVVGAWHIC